MRKLTRGKIRAFLARFATDDEVLDIGSGGANIDAVFPNRVTFDIDPLREPQIVGDIHKMPFKDGEFTTMVCAEVLEHLYDPRKAVQEMQRVLAPGGLLVLTTRFTFPVHDAPHDYFRYTPYGLRELFKEWDIEDLEAETDSFGTIAVLLQRIIFQTDLRGGKVTKGVLWILANILNHLGWLVRSEYGDIKRSQHEPMMLSSGLYIACRKR